MPARIREQVMAKSRKSGSIRAAIPRAELVARDDAIHVRYGRRPSLRALVESGEIEPRARDRAERVRAVGPPTRPFRDLVAALRAERERQGLSLGDGAERTGMDRAAGHK